MESAEGGPNRMREMSFWTFISFYGLLYLIFIGVILGGYFFGRDVFTPVAALIFPIAGGNSLLKNFLVSTGMYWGMVLLYVLVIQKTKLKF